MNKQSLLSAFRYAFQGLSAFIRTDRNGRIHIGAALLAVAGGFFFSISAVEWCLVLFCCGLVCCTEMLNHALEKLCDAVHPEKHPLIKQAKDVAAAAVLFASLISAITGLIIFLPKFISLL
ncbi:diacylglycerol kinase family protein [Sediminibacterium ginsengisoli]|uniref:Undecaprenol kinase n=1 Tax=Sediminibacterium ginsengisoli TaxID=413434 RepID=A0A1T4NIN3_9BACT|nr:diacylglycerol kinase family protein [Sediminibacterium ginsengisoli]SJZ79112.1 undecaprenol kinase [Sediminibacterium ginsengisoli]